MSKNKIKDYLKEKKNDGSITLWSLSAIVFILGGTGFALNSIHSNENTSQTSIESSTLNLEDNSIHSKILSSARLIKIEDKVTDKMEIHLCNVEFQGPSNDDNVIYKDVFSKDLICIIKADCDSVEEDNKIKTDIGLYTDISERPIIYGVDFSSKEIKLDLENITKKLTENKRENKEKINKKY